MGEISSWVLAESTKMISSQGNPAVFNEILRCDLAEPVNDIRFPG